MNTPAAPPGASGAPNEKHPHSFVNSSTYNAMIAYWQGELNRATLRVKIARAKLKELNRNFVASATAKGHKTLESAIVCEACGASHGTKLTRHGPRCVDCIDAERRSKAINSLDLSV